MNIFETRHCRKHEWIFHETLSCPHCDKEGVSSLALRLASDFFVVTATTAPAPLVNEDGSINAVSDQPTTISLGDGAR